MTSYEMSLLIFMDEIHVINNSDCLRIRCYGSIYKDSGVFKGSTIRVFKNDSKG